jgi:hypothetical protein
MISVCLVLKSDPHLRVLMLLLQVFAYNAI